MSASPTQAWKEGYARGLAGKNSAVGTFEGAMDDEKAGQAREEGYRLGYAEYLKRKSK